jgi:hypothetical protein
MASFNSLPLPVVSPHLLGSFASVAAWSNAPFESRKNSPPKIVDKIEKNEKLVDDNLVDEN